LAMLKPVGIESLQLTREKGVKLTFHDGSDDVSWGINTISANVLSMSVRLKSGAW
jgi:hypothetical protein